jgi:hypothetical protein
MAGWSDLTDPRGPAMGPTPRCATCGRAQIAIMVRLDDSCHATMRSCDVCGSSWDINGNPATRAAVHALFPRSESPIAVWRREGHVRPLRRGARRGGGEPGPVPAVPLP